MLTRFPVAAAIAVVASSAVFAQEHRELGPHVHGTGTLNIAIDGPSVTIDFNAPGMDILGFEHKPSTPEQEKILAAATDSLGKPLELIMFPAAAQCTVAKTNVTFDVPEAAGGGEEGKHADFDIDYALTCAAPDKITALDFPYFKRFPGAQKLAVTVIDASGQRAYTATREAPRVTLR